MNVVRSRLVKAPRRPLGPVGMVRVVTLVVFLSMPVALAVVSVLPQVFIFSFKVPGGLFYARFSLVFSTVQSTVGLNADIVLFEFFSVSWV